MMDNFFLHASLLLIGISMIVSMCVIGEAGYRIGRRNSKAGPEAEKLEKTVSTVTGAMLALLGFMLAVSISMADNQFVGRRKLVLDEANAIGTSRLRAQAIGGRHGKEIVRLLIDYAQLRLDFFAAGEDRDRLKAVYDQTSLLQQRTWGHASEIARAAPTPISSLLLASLNDVFDLSTSRRWALEVRVPPLIIQLLLAFSIISLGLLGYYFGICGIRHPILSFVLILAFTGAMLLIIDLNRPRGGFIQAEQSPNVWVLEGAKNGTTPNPPSKGPH